MYPEFRLGEWLVQPQLNLLTLGDKTVNVEPKVMDVLVYLAENAGEVLPKQRLIKAVWSDAFVGDEVLTYSISALRKALSDDARNPRFIQTIPRRGYRLIAAVEKPQQERRFRIVERLGQGAMGEVFLAEDTLLRRQVALKFPLLDSERKEEQEKLILREARAAAALDHPFVCKVYDTGDLDGRFYLAMEYVRGETLEAKLSRGSISWPECLKIARAIAAALEFAHQHGVVHRDVKPANIIISEQGHVKVTDFGVARRVPVEGERQDWTVTLTSEVSTTGTIPYMSPEQVSGSKVDARSDIFSFGVLLYEMLTGENPFRRDTPIETAAAILQLPAPPLPADSNGSEPRLSGALKKMLAKEPSERYQAMSEVRAAFQELEKSPDQALPNSSPLPELPERGLTERDSAPVDTSRLSARLRLRRIARPLLAVLVLATSAGALWWFGFRKASSPVGPADTPMRITPLTTDGGWKSAPALSPDGELIAFFWNGPSKDNFDLYVKPIDPDSAYLRLTSHPAPDSGGSWSPDGKRLAFVRMIGQRATLYTIPSLGGREEKIIEVQGLVPDFLGLENPAPSWSPAGDWLAYAERPSEEEPFRVVLVDPETREKRVLTKPPASSRGDFNPSFSPDGQQLAFVRGSSGHANLDIWVQDLEGGEPRQITSENYQLCYGLSWGRNGLELLYTAGFQFKPRAYRVDLAEPVPRLVAGVGEGASFTSVSGESLVYLRVYQPPPNLWRVPGRLAADRSVPPQELIRSSYPDLNASVSPDGSKIAFSSHRTGRPQIWVAGRDGSNPRRITDVGTEAGTPRWSPDGSRIVFDAVDSGNSDVYVVEVDGGSALRLTDHPSDDMVGTFSRNGRWIYFVSLRSGTSQIWRLPAQGGEAVQITRQGGGYALESWDGSHLYYTHAPEGQSQLSGQNLSLRRVPVGGGEEAGVLGHLEDWTTWDLAPAGIYYSSRTWTRAPTGTPGPGYAQDFRVNYVNLETGKTTEIFGEVGFYNHWFLAVSPDEEWVLFSRFPVAESDLMLVKNFQ